jgi:cell division protein FtsW (lipid II flippase)
MFDVKSEEFKKYISFFIMLLVAAVAVLAVGELCKYVLPHDTAFFYTINKVYFLAVGALILTAGLGMLNLNSLKNLAVFFVGLLALVLILFYVDKFACSALWGGVYASVLQRIPEQYFDMYYKALDVLSIILAAAGLLFLLVKSLDVLKNTLSGTKKA